MNKEESIIAIRNRDINEANRAFADFMHKTEKCFNERSRSNPKLYKSCSATELEKITEQILKDVCPSTPFRPNDIKLVAGHTFPDIMTTEMYGVEVKSTNKDKWTSVGSSIVESTRSEFVERIYMLFGSLGSNPPAFRCKPYQECLSNIAVTHSPRYLIDMDLSQKDNIFSKMQTDYDSFRIMDENDKISRVRDYYIQKARKEHKTEMPWWMGESTSVNLSIYNDVSLEIKRDLGVRSYILFPSLFASDTSHAYKCVALWLCNRYSLLCYNMRDLFSAGGKMKTLNGKPLEKPFPGAVGKLLDRHEDIEALLKHPDKEILQDIHDYWDFRHKNLDLYGTWIKKIESVFAENPEMKDVNIRCLLEHHAHP